VQVFLPQHQSQRITFSGVRINNTTGVGVGYAYMLDSDNRTALTLSVGHAGDETAIRGSVGFEFGGDRRMKIDMSELVPVTPTPTPTTYEPPPGTVLIYADELEELELMAQSSEEVEDHLEQAEYRYAQQQNQIDALEAEHEEDAAEIERLKQEAAALRERQEADEELRESVRQRILDKRKGDEK
jgi:hypothetical protein